MELIHVKLRQAKPSRGGAVRCSLTAGVTVTGFSGPIPVLLVGWEHCPAGLLTCLKGSRECKLRRNSVDAVNAVNVLDQSDLVAGRRTLTGGDGG